MQTYGPPHGSYLQMNLKAQLEKDTAPTCFDLKVVVHIIILCVYMCIYVCALLFDGHTFHAHYYIYIYVLCVLPLRALT